MPAGDNPLIVDLHLAIRNIVLIKTDMGEGGKVKFSTFEGKKKPLCLSPYIATLQSYSQVTVQILRRCGVSRTLLASV